MNIVLNPQKCTKTSITASNKIATWISDLLKIDLVDDEHLSARYVNYDIDTVYAVNGMFGFCKFREDFYKICQKAKKVVWIGNDYALRIPKQIKELPTLERIAQYDNFDNMSNHKMCDFNKLLAWNGTKTPYSIEGLFYFGAFRDGREPSFRHWFSDSAFPIHLSTSGKNMDKFLDINPNLKMYEANGDIKKMLPLFQSSIYIEDETTHNVLMTPANRFYECIGSKILLFYDKKTQNTLTHAGFWDEDFSVSNIDEVKEKLQDYDNLREKQIKMFEGKDFVQELEDEFLNAAQVEKGKADEGTLEAFF